MSSHAPPFLRALNGSIVDDLSELSEVEVEQDGRRARLRTAPGPTIDPICRTLGIALPPVFQEVPPTPAEP